MHLVIEEKTDLFPAYFFYTKSTMLDILSQNLVKNKIWFFLNKMLWKKQN